MSDDTLSISIVMCAYTEDRWSDLVMAISSVKRQTVPVSEIILVIDHNQSLFERAQETFRDVYVIENHDAPGLSGARNSGIACAQGQIICFMDEDAIASSSWIETLLSGYSNAQIIGVGGEVKPLWAGATPGWIPEEFYWVVGCSYTGLPETASPVRNPIGCNMSFRKDALLAAGGFRNGIGRIGTIPVGCEETELSIRIRQIFPDTTILYQPEAVVYHRVPEWRTTWSYFAKRCYAEGLSKSKVTQFVGTADGLSSERKYTSITLPKGIARGIRNTFRYGEVDGIKRAGSIVAGLMLTTSGYLIGKIGSTKPKGGPTTVNSEVAHDMSGQIIL